MDDETRNHLDRMMVEINNRFETALARLADLGADFQNTKSFMIADSIIMGRRMQSLDERVTRLEKR